MAIGIIINLSEGQQESLKPIMEKIKEMADEGKPGMAVAQIYMDHMACGWLTHEKAKQLVESLGGDGSVTKYAYDRA